jgi:hypothetical protein
LRADEPDYKFELFSQIGGSLFSGNSTTTMIPVLDTGSGMLVFGDIQRSSRLPNTVRALAGFRYYFSAADALEISYAFSPTDVKEQDRLLENDGLRIITLGPFVESNAHHVSFNYVRYLVGSGRWRTFVTGGLGVAHFSRTFKPTKFSGNFGGGLDLSLRSNVSLRFEYRDFVVGQPRVFPTSPDGITHNHGPSAGIVWKF